VPGTDFFGQAFHRMEPAGADDKDGAGRRPSERERTSRTPYNSKFRILDVLCQTPFAARRREDR
jgi:hypothetical protein